MQRLGQHFLKNDQAIKRIIAALDIKPFDKAQDKPGEIIIEIGPGKGALTFPLAEECIQKKCRLIAIEKDNTLAQNLELQMISSSYPLCHSAQFGPELTAEGLDAESRDLDPRVSLHSPEDDNGNIEIITGDALKILPKLLSSSEDDNIENYKLIGNIPYYITGKLLRTISELKNKPSVSVLMVQKEVAERICATPPRMNLLAAATQYWASPEIILHLKASEFDPPPEVDSAVIKLTTRVVIPGLLPHASLAFGGTRNLEKKTGFQIKLGMTGGGENERIKNEDSTQEAENYYKLIHIIFKQPRKTLANNLRAGLNISKEEIEKIMNSLNLPPNSRPQDISVEQILKMTSYLSFHT